jgi:hypothetical protein
MRLIVDEGPGNLNLVEQHDNNIPRYAILSHTWGADSEEVTFKDLTEGTGKNKAGYNKIEFCRKQAASDGLQYFWVDTCCIDKSSSTELTEAINSMFRWYENALRCYVYLPDVSTSGHPANSQSSPTTWEAAFRGSRWFTRGWTLQELIAPVSVEFFSREGDRLGSKRSLEQLIHDITGVAIGALRGETLTDFEVEERLAWANHRETKRQEDKAYSLLGIFNIHMPLLYGEGREKAFVRLRNKIRKSPQRKWYSCVETAPFTQLNEASSTTRTGNPTIALTIAQSLDNSIRLLAVGQSDYIKSVKWSVQAADISMATDCVIAGSAAGAFEEQHPSSTSSMYLDLERTVDGIAATWMSIKQISDTLRSVVQRTQDIFMSEDRSLHQYLARIYRDLGQTGSQIQQLSGAIDRFRNLEKGRVTVASQCGGNAVRHPASYSKWDAAEASDRSAIQVFFDCVSRFSSDASSSSIDSLNMSFVGSLERRFQSEVPSFPEQYTLNGLFSERAFAVAMMQSSENHQTIDYFLTYAETPRRWQRVILSTTFHKVRERSDVLQFATTDRTETICVLPSAIQRLLRTLLPCITLDKLVTKLCVSLREDAEGDFIVSSDEIEVTEDDSEVQMSDEKKFLEEIDAMNCVQFVESDIVVQWRIQSHRYKASIGSRQCLEWKVPFARAGGSGENGFQNFLDDIKLHIALRNCSNVVKFLGVVLDDNRLHLKSFLLEYPMLRSLTSILAVANSRSETIPWPIREAWARHIINAIVDVHSRGVVLGVLALSWFGVRADGTAVLVRFKGSQSHLSNRFGEMPPELRNTPQSYSVAAGKKKMNFRTDVFQLGLILWLLMEHKPKGIGYFCARSVCTSYPRYKCEADHSNPVELPEICGSCSPYLHEIIRLSRLQDPKARPSARKLAAVIEGTEDPDTRTSDIEKLLRNYASTGDYNIVFCDECGALMTEDYFHCNVCTEGDFDICQRCFAKGIRCYDSEHLLMKRIMRNDRIVDVS